MFGWLFGRKANRYVFRYRDGTKTRSADPVEVERVLIEHLGEYWRKEVVKLSEPVPVGVVGMDAVEARKVKNDLRVKILTAVNEAFGVKPFKDDAGMTEVERLGLLNGYMLFCIDLVRAASPFAKPRSRASPSPENPPPSSTPASSSPGSPSPAPAPAS